MAKTHRAHEKATVEMFRRDPNLAAEYLNSVQEVARQAEVNAHTLYRTLSEQGNPEIKTLSAILKAMGMRLAVQPIQHSQTCT